MAGLNEDKEVAKISGRRPSSTSQSKSSGPKLTAIFLGPPHTGKTSFLFTKLYDYFPSEYLPSKISPPLLTDITLSGQNSQTVSLEIHDIQGLKKWDIVPSLSPAYSRASVICLCFSISDLGSLGKVRKEYKEYIERHAKGVPFIVVGMKVDLRKDVYDDKFRWREWVENNSVERSDRIRMPYEETLGTVANEDGCRISTIMGAEAYMECSALDGTGVQEVFEKLAGVGYKFWLSEEERKSKVKKNERCGIM